MSLSALRNQPRAWLILSAIEDSPVSEGGGDEYVGHAGPFGDLRRGVHDHVFGREEAKEGAEISDRSPVAWKGGFLDDQEVEVAVRTRIGPRSGAEEDDLLRISCGADAADHLLEQLVI
jgi:hypothetical protein